MKYKVEGDINFYETLINSLDNDSDDEELLCKISGFPLEQNVVTLECNHKFNYNALYKEINKQKYEFKTYDTYSLPTKDQLKMKELKIDYYIKCPYCRNVQFTILPYYEELGLKKVYGINSLENTYGSYKEYGSKDYEVTYYGITFKKGTCCENENNFICKSKYVAFLPDTELSYCTFHYRSGLKKYKLKEKKQKLEEKKKQKEETLVARQKLFEEKNILRAEKGLPPLKTLPRIKPVIENIIEPGQPIGQYIPEDEQNKIVGCKMILKTGPNKGKPCGCKKITENNQCKRHETLNDK
jgi:hypothetical protein